MDVTEKRRPRQNVARRLSYSRLPRRLLRLQHIVLERKRYSRPTHQPALGLRRDGGNSAVFLFQTLIRRLARASFNVAGNPRRRYPLGRIRQHYIHPLADIIADIPRPHFRRHAYRHDSLHRPPTAKYDRQIAIVIQRPGELSGRRRNDHDLRKNLSALTASHVHHHVGPGGNRIFCDTEKDLNNFRNYLLESKVRTQTVSDKEKCGEILQSFLGKAAVCKTDNSPAMEK